MQAQTHMPPVSNSSRGGKRKSYPGRAGSFLLQGVLSGPSESRALSIGVYTRKTARKSKGCIRSFMIKPHGFREPWHISRLINRFLFLHSFSLRRSSIHSKVTMNIALEACCKNRKTMTRTEVFWKDILSLQNVTEHALQSNQGKASRCYSTLL